MTALRVLGRSLRRQSKNITASSIFIPASISSSHQPQHHQQPSQFRKFHIFPGGPQNQNDVKLIRKNLRAVFVRLRRVGLVKTIKDYNQAHEINFGETLGTFRGVDEQGNRYYENLDNQYGRHRWVEYAEKRRENSHASLIPPGWWGWIHHTRNTTPADPETPKLPKWVLLWQENYTGNLEKRYLPPNYGSSTSPVWQKLRYQSWNPNADGDEEDASSDVFIGR